MQDPYILYNGNLVPQHSFAIRTSNRSFKYGDGLFETIRISNGKCNFLSAHFNRLFRGMRYLKMQIPDALEAKRLEDDLNKLIEANGISSGGRLRLTVYRAGQGTYVPVSNTVQYIAEVVETDNDYQLNRTGMNIGIYGGMKKPMNVLSSIKSASALLYVMAGIEQQERHWGEAIILNENGHLCEAVSSNIFIVKDQVLYTPALSEGCIPGVMRNVIINVAHAMEMKTEEVILGIDALKHADEVFFTNAIQGIQWALGFEQKRYFNSISRKLHSGLLELVS